MSMPQTSVGYEAQSQACPHFYILNKSIQFMHFHVGQGGRKGVCDLWWIFVQTVTDHLKNSDLSMISMYWPLKDKS